MINVLIYFEWLQFDWQNRHLRAIHEFSLQFPLLSNLKRSVQGLSQHTPGCTQKTAMSSSSQQTLKHSSCCWVHVWTMNCDLWVKKIRCNKNTKCTAFRDRLTSSRRLWRVWNARRHWTECYWRRSSTVSSRRRSCLETASWTRWESTWTQL